MVYMITYTCPHCKNPTCGDDPAKRANEYFPASTKAEARALFNAHKQCRHMKIQDIRETTLC